MDPAVPRATLKVLALCAALLLLVAAVTVAVAVSLWRSEALGKLRGCRERAANESRELGERLEELERQRERLERDGDALRRELERARGDSRRDNDSLVSCRERADDARGCFWDVLTLPPPPPLPPAQLQQLVYQQVRLAECQMTATLINTSCSAEKLQLQRQLEQAGSSQKNLEESGRQSQAGLAKATQERDRCQQELQSSRAEGDLSRMELQLQRHECRALQSDMNNKFPRISELVKQLQCGEVESELKQLRERALALLREHQERDSQYIWKSRCELNVQQCRLNCSREKQELENRIQALEKREKDGLEERKRLEQEKEKVGKELEEKRKEAAAQAESLREKLGVCMGTKMPHLDLPGSRGPGSAARSGSFSGPGSYMEFLRNPATLGTMGKKNLEELQQMLQVMEQLMATLKSPSG
ncbi:trichohyalin-like [Poecile atricapillus]|uniref:trichohyalin-like n=1 Tax=Poecile atricapillus TaxID=48891 RepID=UPI002738DFDC|nr:trichohyalin-like [Poecile atricapillus]